jgi:hypothetical protein
VNLSILLHGASAASALWGAYLWFKASRVKTPDNFPIHILSTTPFSAEIPPTEIAVIGSSPELDAIGRALERAKLARGDFHRRRCDHSDRRGRALRRRHPWCARAAGSRRRKALIRIAVSARAYRAIKATLPPGSVVYPPERNARGQYLLWLNDAEANRLAALRRRGESYSHAVIRMAKEAAKD